MRREFSAGGVVVREGGEEGEGKGEREEKVGEKGGEEVGREERRGGKGEMFVLMIRVRTLSGSEVWTFPKGHIEEGESRERAALREVEEETGIRAKVVRELGNFTYYFRDKDGELVKKTVFWYLMHPIGGDLSNVKTAGEVLEVRWFNIEKAKEIVHYNSDKKIIQILEELKTK